MSDLLSEFPDRQGLGDWFMLEGSGEVFDVNAHIHTPYSFSAFDDLEQAFKMASDEQVKILGINDFNTTEGYQEFYDLSVKYRIFPLFNIEFMGLLEDEQKKGIRINDPNNPGRIYFSGKGLDFPVSWGKNPAEKVQGIKDESHRQVRSMIKKLNENLQILDPLVQLDFDEIQNKYTRGMVRERHIARAVRLMIAKRIRNAEEEKSFLRRLFGNKEPVASMTNHAALENEIRSRLLKSGGTAYVEEDPSAFLSLDEIISIITDAGGIPCYPVLLDDNEGQFTEFESNTDYLCEKLISRNISCVELIPGRNDIGMLKRFIPRLREKGFVILFGTEHNSPSLEPLKVSARGGIPLNEELRSTAYEGACIIAAHQYLRAKGEQGYVGFPEREKEYRIKEFTEIGKAVIEKFLNT